MAAEPEQRSAPQVGWWAAGIIVALTLTYIAAIGTSALYDHHEPPLAVQNATVNQVISTAPTLLGKNISVNGKVAQQISPEAVTLASEGSGNPTGLLIVGKQNVLPQGLNAGDTVNATGTLGTFSRPQIEKEIGVSLDQQKFAPYEGKPVLVIQSASRGQ